MNKSIDTGENLWSNPEWKIQRPKQHWTQAKKNENQQTKTAQNTKRMSDMNPTKNWG